MKFNKLRNGVVSFLYPRNIPAMADDALIGAIFVLPFTVSYGGVGAALADARRRAAVLVLL